ncbi:hypothetical protein HY993_02515, partial [Candidatus Micrarchaeota archaeon]|nr:hypothetical protein [Candidatus Micrarchaeota archaeon]
MDSANLKYVLLFLLLSAVFIAAENSTNLTNSTNSTLNLTLNATPTPNATAVPNATATPAVTATPAANATPAAASNATNASASSNPALNSTNATALVPKPTALEVEAKYYLNAGEEYKAVNFTSGGNQYTMLLIGGRESVLFDSSLNPLDSTGALSPAITDYIATSVVLPFNSNTLSDLKAKFAALSASTNTCLKTYDDFKQGRAVCYEIQGALKFTCDVIYNMELNFMVENYSFYIVSESTKFPSIKPMLTPALKLFNSTIYSMNASIADLDSTFSSLSFDQIQAKLAAIKTDFTSYEAAYSNFSTVHALMLKSYAFANSGLLNRCSLPSSQVADVKSLVSIEGSFPKVDSMSAQVLSFTSSRAASVAIRKLVWPRKDKLDAFSSLLAKFSSNFSSVNNGQPTFLINSRDAMAKYLANATAATAVDSANAMTGKFDSAYSLSNSTLADSIDSFYFYNQSFYAVQASEKGLAEAYKKYGNVDPRVIDLDNKTKDIRTRFELLQILVELGHPLEMIVQSIEILAGYLAQPAFQLQASDMQELRD